MLQHAQSYNEPETVVKYGQDVEETAEHHDLGVEQPTYVRARVHACGRVRVRVRVRVRTNVTAMVHTSQQI